MGEFRTLTQLAAASKAVKEGREATPMETLLSDMQQIKRDLNNINWQLTRITKSLEIEDE